MCDAFNYLFDNIFIRFGSKFYRQIVGIPVGTNCAPLVADLFLFCYERDFMLSLSDNNQTDNIEAFNSTSRYLDDLLNIDNVDDFNNKSLFLTAKLLKQGYGYNTIRKASSKFYYRHSELMVKYNIGNRAYQNLYFMLI